MKIIFQFLFAVQIKNFIFEAKEIIAMNKITQENFDKEYVDSIEQRQIDKFVCDEMSRQIHRYIKAMSGSKLMMEKFIANLSTLSFEEKEEAVARYIDLNRKAVSGLDYKIVLTRAMANYCDTFSYFISLVTDEKKWKFYLDRIQSKYVQFHEVFEEDGKFGMKDHRGKILVRPLYDFLRTPYVYVDELQLVPIIAEKDGKLGLILPDGKETVIADFIYDDISLRDEYPFFEATLNGEAGLIDREGNFLRE